LTALVVGANGQDGRFVCHHLLARGMAVVAVGRQAHSTADEAAQANASFRYRQVDLREAKPLAAVLDEVQPERIFHLAAVHAHATGQFGYEQRFGDMLDVNIKSVHTVLEHLRNRPKAGHLLYAASIKCFGSPLPEHIDESTPKIDACLYSITKNAAASLIAQYRQRHGVRGGSVYLANHDSALRPASFFIPKLVRALAGQPQSFRTLGFWCDWGSASEYSDIMIDILERAPGEDFVLGSGRCVHARSLVERLLANTVGANKQHISEERTGDDGSPYRIDLTKLEKMVGRVPQVTIEQVVADMLAAR